MKWVYCHKSFRGILLNVGRCIGDKGHVRLNRNKGKAMGKKDFRVTTREDSQLDERLSDYTAVTRISAAAKTLYRRTGNWPIYAAATGSALAMATGASASIISGVYPGSGISVNPGGPTTHVGLIPGLSVKLHALSNGAPNVSSHSAELQLEVSRANIFFSGYSDQAKKFVLGSPIGTPAEALQVGRTENVQRFFLGSASGNFASGKPAFAGLSFMTVGKNTDYAWIELEFTDKAGFPYFLDALAFGVDSDPGQLPGSFAAGQTGPSAAPEPGTMSLAILASGAVGVTALRRRRKQSASAATIS
jgi:hypothetical protein